EELTRNLDDPSLRIDAYNVRWLREFAAGRYRNALAVAVRAFDLERRISDPDAGVRLRESVAALFTMCGRLQDARRVIEEHDELSRRLFPHHRLHAVAMEIEFQEVLAEWEAIQALVPRTRAAVEESLATPCVRGARSLLVCAAACAALGDDPEARALENEAARLGMEGFGSIIDTPRIRLALHRRDLATVRLLFSAWTGVIPRRAVWYFPAAVATQLDALAALGETTRLEEEAAKFLEEESALQLFALRALGIVRRDRMLLRQAADRFEALGFARQAANTRVLV
ncbi:MAG TPA: hypothetical protein VGL18_11800, partial [Actinomycetota bacterium]